MEQTITVTEWMADFIEWAGTKTEDELRKLVRERLEEIKAQNETSQESHIDEGYKWDIALEPNDGVDQWKHGGDCTLCRKASYCLTKCRANKLLKKITTPFLYNLYLTEVPEAAAKQVAGMDPKELLKTMGVLQ